MRRLSTPEEREKAAKLRASGLSYGEIAKQLNRSYDLIRYWLSEERRKKVIETVKARRKRLYPLDRRKAKYTPKERRKRAYLRHIARDEAAKTGEPYQQIYERWGVS
jgi:hypothetical protein